MGLFSKLKKAPKIDLYENHMVVDEIILTFPLSLQDIEKIFGIPNKVVRKDDERIKYVYDKYGAVFESYTEITNHLKSCKVYIDDVHTITNLYLYFGDTVNPMTNEVKEELPNKPCKSIVTFNSRQPSFFYDRAEIGDFNIILWTPYGTNAKGIIEKVQNPISIAYSPKNNRELSNYKIKKSTEKMLHFDNLNFKLAIIQVLMYDLEVLEPYFDIYDFAHQYNGKEIDTDSMAIIKPALNFFEKLPIPKRLATHIEAIYMDGGNEIYMNIIPQWNGEDEIFDLNEITLSELQQFPNLKKATIMSSNYNNVKEIFEIAEIDVKPL